MRPKPSTMIISAGVFEACPPDDMPYLNLKGEIAK